MIEVASYDDMKRLIQSEVISIPRVIEYSEFVKLSISIEGVMHFRNILKRSSEFQQLLADHFPTVEIFRKDFGSYDLVQGTLEVDRVTTTMYAPQRGVDCTIQSVTSDTIVFTTNVPNQALAQATTVGDRVVNVADSSVFYVGMKVIIEETGLQSTVGYVEALPSSTQVKLSSDVKENYTTSAIIRQCTRGRLLLVDSANSLTKFQVNACTMNSVTLITEGEDLTTLTVAGNTARFTDEKASIDILSIGSDQDVAVAVEGLAYKELNTSGNVEKRANLFYGKEGYVVLSINLDSKYGDYLTARAWDFKSKAPSVATTFSVKVFA